MIPPDPESPAATTAPSASDSSDASPSGLGQRVITGVAVGAFALFGIFYFPDPVAFVIWLAVFLVAATEFVAIVRHWAPSAPLRGMLFWVPVAAVAGAVALGAESAGDGLSPEAVLAVGMALVAAAALTTLLGRSSVADGAACMGLLAFGIPYFALPPLALYRLHLVDDWLVLLVVAIVAFGDSGAYFVGRAFGRHKLAPVVSPKKTWEGAAGGLAAALLVTAAWSWWRLGEIRPELLALAALAAVAGQLGDLVESLVKRGAGVKDSGRLLPGHGGLYDRLDALLLAAPVFAVGLAFLGFDRFVP